MFEKIINWNKERGLLKRGFDQEKETSFIIEELLEATGNFDSISARAKAVHYAKEITENSKNNEHQIVDALFDIIIFATGAIGKLGYDPSEVMDEGFKEINSRTGTLIDGKFVKDPDAKKYEADFTHCKLN